MDTTAIPATDIVVTENAIVVEDYTNTSFGKEIGKTLVISAATTAGMVAGGFAFFYASKKFSEFKTRRAARHTTVDGEIADVTETPTETE